MYWNELKNKTWIDWVKILVAVDIAGAGIGLILNVDMHVFAYLLRIIGLGFLSQTFFGVLYIFVALLIFKRIFPQKLAEDEHVEAKRMDEDIVDTTKNVKKALKKMSEKAAVVTEEIHEKIDDFLDKSEKTIKKGHRDAKAEIDKLIKD